MVDALTKADEIVEQQLDAYASDIEHILDGDIFSICGPLVYGVEDHILDVIESISPKKHKLIVVLETPGGYIEVAERISVMFRKHYHLVDLLSQILRCLPERYWLCQGMRYIWTIFLSWVL